MKPNPKTGNTPGTNSGHGYAWRRPDGVLARCGGPSICQECSSDVLWNSQRLGTHQADEPKAHKAFQVPGNLHEPDVHVSDDGPLDGLPIRMHVTNGSHSTFLDLTTERARLIAEAISEVLEGTPDEMGDSALRNAIYRGGMDISACGYCGHAVVCIPEGFAICDQCAQKEQHDADANP